MNARPIPFLNFGGDEANFHDNIEPRPFSQLRPL
jgi:hypothetical protein